MARRLHFSFGEWYHCFNRGVDKRDIFENEGDANRFLMLLYLANSEESVDLYDINKPSLENILSRDRGAPIVSIGAYCLMQNHYHILVKEIAEGGITSFMRRIGTAYTMYFNAKYERVGHLFTGPFRSRHIENDRYFQKVLQYIHCNPAELYETGWKVGRIGSIFKLEEQLLNYPYSSFGTFMKKDANQILSKDVFDIANQMPSRRMLEEARNYYSDLAKERFER